MMSTPQEGYRRTLRVRTAEGDAVTLIVTLQRGHRHGRVWLSFGVSTRTTVALSGAEVGELTGALHAAVGHVSAADLAAVIADRPHGCVTPTPSGWVKLAGAAIGGQLVLTVTTWRPLSAGMPALNRTVALGLASASPGARPGTAEC